MATSPTEYSNVMESIVTNKMRSTQEPNNASLLWKVDTPSQSARERIGKIQIMMRRLATAISYLEPGTLELCQNRLPSWNEEEFGLASYYHFSTTWTEQTHVRSAGVTSNRPIKNGRCRLGTAGSGGSALLVLTGLEDILEELV